MTSKPFILTRTFDAPRKLVWEVMTQAEHLKHWMGPTGQLTHATVDLRPGGVFHYGMAMPDGTTMWGKWTFKEIVPPEKLVVLVSFSDENKGETRHPMAPVPKIIFTRRLFDRSRSVARSGRRPTYQKISETVK